MRFSVWCVFCLLAQGSLPAQTNTVVPPFRILSIALQNQRASISINSATGSVYTLQTSDVLQTYWTDLTNRPGNGAALSFDMPLNDSRIFYRVAGLPANRLTLVPSSPLLSPGETSLPDATAGRAYAKDVSPAATGNPPYDLQFSGSTPDGISAALINNHSSNAVLRLSSTGTNLVAGQRRQLTVTVTDATGSNYSHSYDLRVIPPPPALLTTQITLKTGAAARVALAVTNGTPPLNWTVISGDLPAGIAFSPTGALSGTPTEDASELNEDGLYTNVFQVADSFTDRVTGKTVPRVSCGTITTLVRLSYYRNLILNRPNGPAFGGICVGCHGPTFPPDFTSGSALSLMYISAGTGGQCNGTYTYVVPSDPFNSLLYEKITSPPCGAQMPQGGPYFNYIVTQRVWRWINELTGADND
ncbi:MAG TPA: hypothetical protein VKY92_12720 [Verrucomicrobiae bacterium]|nr:hypothetical protein [Verrucomicrobiae bacterium]